MVKCAICGEIWVKKNDSRKCLNFWISLSIWLLYIVNASFNIYCGQIRSLSKNCKYKRCACVLFVIVVLLPKQTVGKDCRFLLLQNATSLQPPPLPSPSLHHHSKCNVIKNFQNTLKCSQTINLSSGRASSFFLPYFILFCLNANIIQTILDWMFVCILFVYKTNRKRMCNVYLCASSHSNSGYSR